MKTSTVRVVTLFALAALAPVRAAEEKTYSVSSAAHWELGTLEGAAIDGEGRVRLAQRLEALWGPSPGIVWDVDPVPDADAAFVGLSAPGRVVRVGAGAAEGEVWFEAGEDEIVAAVVADRAGGVYFALSPGGKILHASEPGAATLLAETGATFVWALAAGPAGLYAGTGDPGRIVLVPRRGDPRVVFDAGDDPIRCLALAEDGTLYAGSAGQGRVIRVGRDGTPFVLHDADETEIVAVVPAEDGTVFALAALGSRQISRGKAEPQAMQTVRVTAKAPEEDENDAEGDDDGDGARPRPAPAPAPPRFQVRPGASVYRIDPSGDVRSLWSSTREVPFGMVAAGDGDLILATGDDGRIRRLDREGAASVVARIGSEQASAIAAGAGGAVWIGGTTDARIERLRAATGRAGSYLTFPIDAGSPARWGRVARDAELPRGGGLATWARVGNSAAPDDAWSPWTRVRADGTFDLPVARWLQVRFDLEAGGGGASPLLRSFDAFYRPLNRRPVLGEVAVQPAGVVWTENPRPAGQSRGPAVADDPVARQAERALSPSVATAVRKSYERGARTVSWSGSDPDGDSLVYAVEIRREGTDVWIPLEAETDVPFFAFDTRALPDGLYRVRVRASDGGNNPPAQALSDARTSPVLWIDNTRPSLRTPSIARADDGIAVRFVATDPGGNVAAVEVAVGGGEWRPLVPTDGVADSPEESYAVTLGPDEVSPDAATLRIRVTDRAGNLGGDAWPLP